MQNNCLRYYYFQIYLQKIIGVLLVLNSITYIVYNIHDVHPDRILHNENGQIWEESFWFLYKIMLCRGNIYNINIWKMGGCKKKNTARVPSNFIIISQHGLFS